MRCRYFPPKRNISQLSYFQWLVHSRNYNYFPNYLLTARDEKEEILFISSWFKSHLFPLLKRTLSWDFFFFQRVLATSQWAPLLFASQLRDGIIVSIPTKKKKIKTDIVQRSCVSIEKTQTCKNTYQHILESYVFLNIFLIV